MVNVIRAVCVTSAILLLSTVAAAGMDVPSPDQSDRAVSAAVAGAHDDPGAAIGGDPFAVSIPPRTISGPPAPRLQSGTASSRRDSLWNGVLLGAAAGALAGALGGEAAIDCSECAGFNVPLTFGVIGAGVGAGVGAWIDALRHSRSIAPHPPARITVAPLLGRGHRAVVARVRF